MLKFISNLIRIVKTINGRCLFWDVLEMIFAHFFCVGHFGIFPFGILPFQSENSKSQKIGNLNVALVLQFLWDPRLHS